MVPFPYYSSCHLHAMSPQYTYPQLPIGSQHKGTRQMVDVTLMTQNIHGGAGQRAKIWYITPSMLTHAQYHTVEGTVQIY